MGANPLSSSTLQYIVLRTHGRERPGFRGYIHIHTHTHYQVDRKVPKKTFLSLSFYYQPTHMRTDMHIRIIYKYFNEIKRDVGKGDQQK